MTPRDPAKITSKTQIWVAAWIWEQWMQINLQQPGLITMRTKCISYALRIDDPTYGAVRLVSYPSGVW